MSVSPFIKRELRAAARSGSLFSDRFGSVIFVVIVACGHIIAWDYMGVDRHSTAGARLFALSVYATILAMLFAILIGRIPALVAPGVAMERDRKTLDSLLATGFTSAEIILGKICAALLRYANSLFATIPIWVLLVFLGGVDLRWIALGLLALFSTAVAIAALSAAVSAGAKSATSSTTAAVGWGVAWMTAPMVMLSLLPKLWPAAPQPIATVLLTWFDSSPMAILTTVMGVVPRGPLITVIVRMIALQSGISVALMTWAIVRLRPASRAVDDNEGRNRLHRILKARWRPRPACTDDPILWREMHSARASSPAATFIDRAANLLWLGLFAYATSWFAIPALAEVAQYGFTKTPGTPGMPEITPIARVVSNKFMAIGVPLTPGWARLEFNIVIRQVSVVFAFMYALMLGGIAAESIAEERQRETWLGLIATPLTGWEIIRGKWIGAIWKARTLSGSLVSLWVIGLLGGALHPVGFAMSLIGIAVASAFLASLGVIVSLWSRDRAQATGRILGLLMLTQSLGTVPLFFPGIPSVVLAALSFPFQSWCGLLSYDDVHLLLQSSPSPQFASIGLAGSRSVWLALGSWLTFNISLAIAAVLLLRSAVRNFDAAVGRPVRSSQRSRSNARVARPDADTLINQGVNFQKI